MPTVNTPAFWGSLAVLIATTAGVSDPGLQANIKELAIAGAAIVIAVWQWQHHRTIRSTNHAAVQIAEAKANVAASNAINAQSQARIAELGVTPPTVAQLRAAPPYPDTTGSM